MTQVINNKYTNIAEFWSYTLETYANIVSKWRSIFYAQYRFKYLANTAPKGQTIKYETISP